MFVLYNIHSLEGISILSVHEKFDDAKSDLMNTIKIFLDSLPKEHTYTTINETYSSTKIEIHYQNISQGWMWNSYIPNTYNIEFIIKSPSKNFVKLTSNKHASIVDELKEKLKHRRESISGKKQIVEKNK